MSWQRATELVELLAAGELRATADPRSVVAPCILVTPPTRTYDVPTGYTATWQLVALVPGPGTADAFRALAQLVDATVAVLELAGVLVELATPAQYTLTPGSDPLPAYLLTFTESE
jgi:hypothetical protein